MKVRITRATSNNWYHVGEEYDVEESLTHDRNSFGDYHALVGNKQVGIGVGHFEVIDDEPKFPFKVRCIDNSSWEDYLKIGSIYTASGENMGTDYFIDDVKNPFNKKSFMKSRFEIVDESYVNNTPTHEEGVRNLDAHYSFNYALTDTDREKGVIKVDPYFVAKQWRLGSKDDTGVLFHCLKNISRYSDKNSKEREIKALHLQIKRLAELEGVSLNEMVLEIRDKK